MPPTPPRLLAALARYLAPHAPLLAALVAALVVGTLLQLLVPQVLRRFIDAATGTLDASLGVLASTFLALALGNQLLGATAAVLGTLLGQRATNALRRDLLAHVLGLDLGAHARRRPGEWIERIDADATALADFFAQFTGRVVSGLLLSVGVLVVLTREEPLLGLTFTLFVALEIAVLFALRRIPVAALAAEREASAQLFGFLEERTRSLGDLRANGAAAHALARFAPVMAHFRAALQRSVMQRSAIWLLGLALFSLGVTATLALSIRLVGEGLVTVGTAYMVFQYLLMLQGPIEQLTQQLQVLQRAGASLGRIDALFAERSALASGDADLPDGPLSIRLEGVDFRYPDAVPLSPPTLTGVDLSIPAGAHVGLVGRTGSGKTTLTRLLFRWFDPTAGRVLIGGVDASTVPLAALRRRIGFLTQEVHLVAGSVRDNLTFYDDRVPDAALHAALREVGMEGWLARVGGLDAVIGSGGGTLSAGEAQLLALARLFLADPGIVVLDEPTSRLDPDTEARLERALARLLASRTAVIIAHRLATIERVDFICGMRDGRVAEFGARAALAADPSSSYARLLAAAAAGATPEDLA